MIDIGRVIVIITVTMIGTICCRFIWTAMRIASVYIPCVVLVHNIVVDIRLRFTVGVVIVVVVSLCMCRVLCLVLVDGDIVTAV